jgi:hypothetical protein
MTHGVNGKIVTRILALVFVGLAFAGCAAMFAADRPLFAEASSADLSR